MFYKIGFVEVLAFSKPHAWLTWARSSCFPAAIILAREIIRVSQVKWRDREEEGKGKPDGRERRDGSDGSFTPLPRFLTKLAFSPSERRIPFNVTYLHFIFHLLESPSSCIHYHIIPLTLHAPKACHTRDLSGLTAALSSLKNSLLAKMRSARAKSDWLAFLPLVDFSLLAISVQGPEMDRKRQVFVRFSLSHTNEYIFDVSFNMTGHSRSYFALSQTKCVSQPNNQLSL